MVDDANKTVFISYRRQVASFIARAVFQDLRANGWDVFMDVQSIDAGEFDRIILNQIAARAHFVVILTPGTLERCANGDDWLRREIEYAFEKERNIVPLLANSFDFASNKAHLTGTLAELQRRNALNVPHDYFEEAMERLRTRYLKQPVYGAIVPTPADEKLEVERRVTEATAQPQVTSEQLTAEQYLSRAYKKHQEHNDYSGAIEDYTQAIRLNPKFADAYINRGAVHHDKGDLNGALADFDEAIHLDPKYAIAYNNRGTVRKDKGDLDGAIADYNEALRLNPNYANPHWGLGNCYYAREDWARALDAYETYLRLVKGTPSDFVVGRVKELKRKLGR
ncbi:MAG: tetratricopeptide repeat protein [Anaerolineae bacterium]|nr:tetratricopeptide repeat protein [Anaerolineae bacterium]